MSLLIQIPFTNLEHALASVEKLLSELDAKLRYKIMFIIEEILTNLARHAEFQDREPDVTLEVQTSPMPQLEFNDNSEKFNMLEYPDPDIDEDIEKRELGGLGIFLTKKYAKNIEYLYENGYNTLRVLL